MTQLDPLGPVTIGAREIYDQLLQTDRKIDGVRGEVAQVAQAHGELVKDAADHEARIRALERSRWPLPSLAAVVSIISVVLAVISFIATRGA
ncbi:hypothetical protein ACFFV7_50890 [Nonomuraea spiralis]|uniref:Uncharacterized protein n=1 Tax=Nonomuraea spiralis TaxID=46182 RepID=A0ABV5IZY3_9ACTN|nr:hypothetical protein [Nonomuraea spiralis]GGS88602.1 hypothetical protein GCM10010176_035480 [Nonomuraea spiralis]